MTTRTARLLVRLYPLPWRRRYGEEFEEFLFGEKPGFRGTLDVVYWAVRERINHLGEFTMTNLSARSRGWYMHAWLPFRLGSICGRLWMTPNSFPACGNMPYSWLAGTR
jgi:hypothetical protein